ncbi:hypothetical protein CDV31_004622 [Fusarium ambrosium]|uniref:Thioredoxin domain-containing protein n=1 Tax=Fusarium ambrosium TaxID=131363 RepID=A0A428UP98_9HYPO|nr:hypothetical protein CDV31_004622 [Fusarium ambrosium]
MDNIYYILLGLLALFIVGPALFSDRSPIPETSGKVYKITNEAELNSLLSSPLACGKLAFAKVNVDHVGNVAGKYSVSAMPTFVVFQNGVPKGVAVEGISASRSVSLSDDGLVERIRGADRAALQATVQALAAKE